MSRTRPAYTADQKAASALAWNQLLVELRPDDVLTVNRNTKGNHNPGHTQELTVAEALHYGAWDTVQGTMAACVSWHGIGTWRIGDRVFALVDTGDQAAREYGTERFGDRPILTSAPYN